MIVLVLTLLLATSASAADCDKFLIIGKRHYENNAYVLAEESFRAALRCDSSLAEAYQSLGVLYYAQDRHNEALVEWRKALSVNPAYPDRKRVFLFMGIAALFSPDLAGDTGFIWMARQYFDSALSIDPRFAEAHYWKGRTYELIPDLDSAKLCYIRCTKLDNKYAPAYNSWGLILYAQDSAKNAISQFNRALFLEKESLKGSKAHQAVYHWNLGCAYQAIGRINAAYEEIEKALKLNPNILTDSDLAIIRAEPGVEAEQKKNESGNKYIGIGR
jgi:tetratricopeptide (TPR) repeat protein